MPSVSRLNRPTYKMILSLAFALVWMINGLICKLLNVVPRHQQIVSQILGDEFGFFFTKVIGILEIFMAFWIVSRIEPRLCAFTQIALVAAMNILEIILVPDLLLFGRLNALVGLFFILLIYLNEFVFESDLF